LEIAKRSPEIDGKVEFAWAHKGTHIFLDPFDLLRTGTRPRFFQQKRTSVDAGDQKALFS